MRAVAVLVVAVGGSLAVFVLVVAVVLLALFVLVVKWVLLAQALA